MDCDNKIGTLSANHRAALAAQANQTSPTHSSTAACGEALARVSHGVSENEELFSFLTDNATLAVFIYL